jgi:DNA-binding Lrp family transcriptional regulator
MDALLKLLEENALASPETLAAQLNLTPDEVRRAIKQLEGDRVILAYQAIVDGERANRTQVKAVIERSASLSTVRSTPAS